MGMTRPSIQPQGPSLPVKGDLKLPTALSLLVVVVMAVASLAGWFFSSALYPTPQAI